MARFQGNKVKPVTVALGAVGFAILVALLFWILRPTQTETENAAPENSIVNATSSDSEGGGSGGLESATPNPTRVAQTLETPLPTATTFATPQAQETVAPTVQSTPVTAPTQNGALTATPLSPGAGATTLNPDSPDPNATPLVGATAPPLVSATQNSTVGATVAPTSSGY